MQARLKTDVPLDNNNRPAMEVAGLECLAENPSVPAGTGISGSKKIGGYKYNIGTFGTESAVR